MATPEQLKANRENAQHSTGPVTPEGKAASSRNHTKHGLRGLQLILNDEDKAEFEQIVDTLRADFRPQEFTEFRIIREMADAEFRLRRCRDLMHVALHRQMEKLRAAGLELSAIELELSAIELEVRAIETLSETGCSWSTWLRYEAQYQREYRRAHKDWTDYKKDQSKVFGYNMDIRHYRRQQEAQRRFESEMASNVSEASISTQPTPPAPEVASNVPNRRHQPTPPHQKAA